MNLRPLTTKQQKFVDAYDGNASAAALKAGYSEKTAPVQGCENLKKPNIIAAIQARDREPRAKTIATREQRQTFWTGAMQNMKLDMRIRLKASELLGRSEADFTENIQGDMSINVIRKEYKPK